MAVKLMLAVSNEEYAIRFFDAIKDDGNFIVAVYTNKEAMLSALSSKKYDVILCDKTMADESMLSAVVCAQLSDPEDNLSCVQQGFIAVNMYQNVQKTMRIIREVYAEKTPQKISFNDKKVKVVTVYSPAGGTGKTTCAIAMALSANAESVRALYVSFESISSLSTFTKCEGERGLSEIFGKLDTNINFSEKLKSLLKSSDGLNYFDSFDNYRDLMEIEQVNIQQFLDIVASTDICDVIIIDMDSSFSNLTTNIIDKSDKVVVVYDESACAKAKLETFLAKASFTTNLEGKLCLVANKGAKMLSTPDVGVKTLSANLINSYDAMEVSASLAATKQISLSKVLY
ncbi:MAG: AAA family ATPase [Christensenella sp.]